MEKPEDINIGVYKELVIKQEKAGVISTPSKHGDIKKAFKSPAVKANMWEEPQQHATLSKPHKTLNNLFFSIFRVFCKLCYNTHVKKKIPLTNDLLPRIPFHSWTQPFIIHSHFCLAKYQTLLSAVCLALRFYENSFCL